MKEKVKITTINVEGVLCSAKQCRQCKEIKQLEYFHKGTGVGNRNAKCIKCRNKTEIRKINSSDYTEINEKKCTKCNKILQLELFSISKKGVKGRSSWCKQCTNEKNRVKNRKNNSWCETTVLEKIEEIIKNNEPMNSYYIQNNYSKLYNASNFIFGSWGKAIEKVGINYSSISKRKRWTDELVMREVKLLHDTGIDISSNHMQKNYTSLYLAGSRRFNGWNNVISKCGFDYCKIRKTQTWTKEKVIEEIITAYNNNIPIIDSYMNINNVELYKAAYRYFGSWNEAVSSSGIDYDYIRQDKEKVSYCGLLFEKLLGEILNELSIKWEKGYTYAIRPDFRIKHNTWIDAKLSEWTIFNCNTVSKYEEYCKFLTIIYLRGNRETDIMITNKTRMISVYKLIKQLPKHKQKYYVNEIEKIENELQIIETKEYIKQAN